MLEATLVLDRDFCLARVDERMFGSFVEHVGRAVYGGIYEPGHPSADADGMRTDVLALVRELGITLVRYPGGNFVSGFRWEDSVGPLQERPVRLSLAWPALESNEVGLHEFAAWAQKAGCRLFYAINLGTRGLEDARNLVEYANIAGGSYYSDLRRKNGAADPFGIRLWCLGNEMDAPWQMGEKTPENYGLLANEAAKIMKMVDPHLEVVACGSSSPLPQFGNWESGVLSRCYDTIDYLSVHRYCAKEPGMKPVEYLLQPSGMDEYIAQVLALCDAEGAKRRSKKKLSLSFDEWNVWYHSKAADEAMRGRTEREKAPALLEDVYTFEDALVTGGMFLALLRHADRIKIACMAQLVNAIAPIMTQNGGPAWRQTTYWPFYHLSRYGRGTVLQNAGSLPLCDGGGYGAVPALDTLAVLMDDGSVNVFVINRAQEPVVLRVDARAFGGLEIARHVQMTSPDLLAVNDAANPQRVVPQEGAAARDGRIALEPLSWNVIFMRKRG